MSKSKVEQIIEDLKTLSLLEASELVKAIEETFGVSAAAPVAVAAVSANAAGSAPAVEEKSEFDVVVDSVPADKKIAIIKVVKDKKGIGLADAKTLVEGAPFTMMEKLSKEEATKLKEELSGAGATVTLK
jgi:large subunit ribosomal protein L7/L12